LNNLKKYTAAILIKGNTDKKNNITIRPSNSVLTALMTIKCLPEKIRIRAVINRIEILLMFLVSIIGGI
tara:strand:- start:33 stop:239 length:207 start_codon:yes stop_codon:yes gene_type:complete